MYISRVLVLNMYVHSNVCVCCMCAHGQYVSIHVHAHMYISRVGVYVTFCVHDVYVSGYTIKSCHFRVYVCMHTFLVVQDGRSWIVSRLYPGM